MPLYLEIDMSNITVLTTIDGGTNVRLSKQVME